jgi:hypothetical protein
MKITWKLTHTAVPEVPPGPDLTAFDGEKAIGRVRQIEHGAERGLWSWEMTVVRPGPAPTHPTSGRAAERGKAGRCLVQAYRRLLVATPAGVAKQRLSTVTQTPT